MLIPVNPQVAIKMAETSLAFQEIWKELGRAIERHCQDNILVFEAYHDCFIMDLPYKSRKNGATKVISLINNAWYYDPSNPKENVLDYHETEKGLFLLLKIGPKTTDLHPANRFTFKEEDYESIKRSIK